VRGTKNGGQAMIKGKEIENVYWYQVHLQSCPCTAEEARKVNEGLELDVPCICTVECPRAIVIDAMRMSLSAQCT